MNHSITYKIIRSRRRTLGVEIRGGEVIVRAPLRCPIWEIESFVRSHIKWIERHLAKTENAQEKAQQQGILSEEEIRTLTKQAKEVIPQRAAYYAQRIGVSYGKITIRCQKTRWGSCSSKGNLSFNCLLMLTQPEVLDSVVVHELCHRKFMNHSQQFYQEVLKAYPEYRKWNRWLKKNGAVLLRRAGKE